MIQMGSGPNCTVLHTPCTQFKKDTYICEKEYLLMKRIIKLLALMGFISLFASSCDDLTELSEELSLLEVEQTDYEVEYLGGYLDIKVKAQGDIVVACNVDWISDSIYESDNDTYVRLLVDYYEDINDDRTGTVDIKLKGTIIATTITIIQKAPRAVLTDRRVYQLSLDEQTFDIPVTSNCEYDIRITDEGKDWLTYVESPDTKALTEKILTFKVLENNTDENREADIVLSIPHFNDSTVIRVIQNGTNHLFIPALLKRDSKCQLFYEALKVTRLSDTLEQYIDECYPGVDYEQSYEYFKMASYSREHTSTAYERYYLVWPNERLFKYTLFAVPDSILKAKYGIDDLEGLRRYAQNLYPDGASLPEEDRNNSLNQLLSYHILPCELTYDQFNISNPKVISRFILWSEYDIEDFYETLLPHSIMRISTPKGAGDKALGIYINRKGTTKNGLEASGVRIAEPSEYKSKNTALNGVFHYVDNLLAYDDETKYTALNTRIRVMTSTLSPDFVNSGAHALYSDNPYVQAGFRYLNGFCKNFYWSDDTWLTICPHYEYFPLGERNFIRGPFDIAFKLPSVPFDATYQIRLLFWNLPIGIEETGFTQFSLFDSGDSYPSGDMTTWNWENCGDAVDLKKNPEAWVADNDDMYDGMSQQERMEAIKANDKVLSESGYMKAMDTYFNGSYSFRDENGCFRKIISTHYLESDKNYYLRLKSSAVFDLFLTFIELVPKDVYDGVTDEDWH